METQYPNPNPNPNPNHTDETESDDPTTRRIRRLSLHLLNHPDHDDHDHDHPQLQTVTCGATTTTRKKKLDVDTARLSECMRGKHREIQEKVFEYFNARPELQTPLEISKDEHRELCMRQLIGLVREANIRPFRYVVEEPSEYFAILEAVGSVDMSLGIKMGVQYRYGGDLILIIATKDYYFILFFSILGLGAKFWFNSILCFKSNFEEFLVTHHGDLCV